MKLYKGVVDMKIDNNILSELKGMQEKTFDEVKDSEYTDFKDIKIDVEEVPIVKCMKFLQQVKNPFFFKSGDMKVKLTYDENGIRMNDALKRIINSEMKD